MLKLFTIDVSIEKLDTIIAKTQKHFYTEINKKRSYNGYEIKYHSFDSPDDAEKCYQKFAIGKIENHPSKKYDFNRLKRLHWIHMTLDYMIKNKFKDPDNQIIVLSDIPNINRDKFNLYLLNTKYNYILIINVTKKIMLVSTAYPIPNITKYSNFYVVTDL